MPHPTFLIILMIFLFCIPVLLSHSASHTKAARLEKGEITKEEHDEWRYKYPELDTHQIWAKVPPQELFDFINEAAKEAESTEKKEPKRKKKK